jgi:hypothetical protein
MPDPSSRYATVEVAAVTVPDGAGGRRDVRYLRRRFPPQPGSLTASAQHVVSGGDRLDLLSATYLGDPALFWRICDANPVVHPDELTGPERIGRSVRIPLPGL